MCFGAVLSVRRGFGEWSANSPREVAITSKKSIGWRASVFFGGPSGDGSGRDGRRVMDGRPHPSLPPRRGGRGFAPSPALRGRVRVGDEQQHGRGRGRRAAGGKQ